MVAVKAPGFGDRRKAMLQDMAILTGARSSAPRSRPQARPGRPGGARLRPPRHRHQGRHHDRRRRRHAEDVAGRVAQIKAEIEASDSDWDREKLQERLAKLAGGVGVIKVGAATEVELKERKHRLEDAISATRAAVEEGIVAGGGAALVHAAKVLDGDLGLTGDETTGVAIVRKRARRAAALDRRERRPRGLVVAAKVARARRRATASTPPPASTSTWSRPASSTRSRSPAPRCATPPRSRRMLLTTETLVAEKPAEEEPEAAHGGHGHSH